LGPSELEVLKGLLARVEAEQSFKKFDEVLGVFEAVSNIIFNA